MGGRIALNLRLARDSCAGRPGHWPKCARLGVGLILKLRAIQFRVCPASCQQLLVPPGLDNLTELFR